MKPGHIFLNILVRPPEQQECLICLMSVGHDSLMFKNILDWFKRKPSHSKLRDHHCHGYQRQPPVGAVIQETSCSVFVSINVLMHQCYSRQSLQYQFMLAIKSSLVEKEILFPEKWPKEWLKGMAWHFGVYAYMLSCWKLDDRINIPPLFIRY